MGENLSEIKNKTIKGAFWRFGERISSQVVSFIVTIILARLLLPEQYGVIALTQIFIVLADVFVSYGLGTAIVQKKQVDERDLSTMFWTGIGLSLLFYIALFIASPYIAKICKCEELSIVLRVMGLRLPIASFNSIQQAIVSRLLEFRKFFYSTLIGTLMSGIVGIAMALMGFGVWALVLQYISSSVFNSATLLFVDKWLPKFIFSKRSFLEMFSYGWNLMLTGFIGTFFDQFKNFIIGTRFTTTDLAYYNRGEHIPSLLSTNINSTIDSVIFPALAKVQDDKETVKKALRRSMKISGFLIFPLLFIMCASSENIIKILLTDKWIGCVPYMQIICIQCCFQVFNTANLQAIKAIGRSDVTLKLEMIKKPILLLVILITMQISVQAIVWGYMIYSILAAAINAYPNRRLISYSFRGQIADLALSFMISIIAGIVAFLLGLIPLQVWLLLFLQLSAGCVAYAMISYVFQKETARYVVSSLKSLH